MDGSSISSSRCTARCRVRSSWTAGTPGCARPCGAGRCRGSTAPGAARRGSHCPNSSRKLNTRSLARAFSSSRRAPPKTASNRCPGSPRSRAVVCSRLRLARGPVSSRRGRRRCRPARSTTTSRRPSRGDGPVAELDDLVEVVAGVDVHDGERQRRRPERLGRQVQHDHRVLAAGEQQHRPLERGGDLSEDVHGFRFERAAGGTTRTRAVRSWATPRRAVPYRSLVHIWTSPVENEMHLPRIERVSDSGQCPCRHRGGGGRPPPSVIASAAAARALPRRAMSDRASSAPT